MIGNSFGAFALCQEQYKALFLQWQLLLIASLYSEDPPPALLTQNGNVLRKVSPNSLWVKVKSSVRDRGLLDGASGKAGCLPLFFLFLCLGCECTGQEAVVIL